MSEQFGIATSSTNSHTTGFGGFYESRFPNDFLTGVRVTHNRLVFNQTFKPGIITLQSVNSAVNAWEVGPYATRRWNPNNWFEIQITGGPVIAVNRAWFEWLDRAGLLIRETRTHTGLNLGYGASVAAGPWNGLGALVGVKRTEMFRRNGDNNNAVFVGGYVDYSKVLRRTPP